MISHQLHSSNNSNQRGDGNRTNGNLIRMDPSPTQALHPNQQQQSTVHVLHQQASMFAHVSPVFGAPYVSNSNDNFINNPNQLMRSKSLNDISHDPQILAFAPSRSENPNHNPNDINSPDCNNIVDSNLMVSYQRVNYPNQHDGTATSQCLPTDETFIPYNIYDQRCKDDNIESNQTSINGHAIFNNQITNQQRNNTYNQCSSNRTSTSVMASTTMPANVFNICNPLAMNLNGLTEQIGNLQL